MNHTFIPPSYLVKVGVSRHWPPVEESAGVAGPDQDPLEDPLILPPEDMGL